MCKGIILIICSQVSQFNIQYLELYIRASHGEGENGRGYPQGRHSGHTVGRGEYQVNNGGGQVGQDGVQDGKGGSQVGDKAHL